MKKIKIGICLLVALAFIMPTIPVFADNPQPTQEAEITEYISKEPIREGRLEGNPLRSTIFDCPVGVVDIHPGEEESPIATGTYDVTIEVCKLDHLCEEQFCREQPAVIKKFGEIYKYWDDETPGETVEVYCEDFEDPCEIYENWATIDQPIWGDNGALDTWTWSEKRSHSPDHSMHSTAFDIYLPNQLDFLVLNGVDVSEYDDVELDFWHWMEGDAIDDGGSYIIQDGGYVEYSFDGVTYTQISEVFYDNDWENEVFDIDVSGEDELFVRFVFFSDPVFCYEGWYIDDVCIYGIVGSDFEDGWELVWDSHSHPQELFEECEEYTFPLPWIVLEEGLYLVCGWIQVLDECHYSVTEYDNMYCEEVVVGDIFDIADVDLYTDPACPVFEGDDLTIFSEVCNEGTLDATDVQVQITVQRGFIDEILNTGFSAADEVQPADIVAYPDYSEHWFRSATAGRSDWHFTDTGSSGDFYLANFEESTMEYIDNTVSGTEWVSSPYMFSGADRNFDVQVEFDVAWALPDDGLATTWHIAIMDDSAGRLYYFSDPFDPGALDGALSNGDGSFVHIGPIGVSTLISSLVGAGYSTDADTDLGFMIFMFKTGDTDSGLSWSGIKLDNFAISKLVVQEEPIIFQETQIVPYLNVSDCVTLDFLWEDVGVGQYVITETVLTEDDDMSNNELLVVCNVINIEVCAEELECVDYTYGDPGHWVPEGCCGGVLWAGDTATTAYGNDWDTSLYMTFDDSEIFDLSGGPHLKLFFDTWYQINAGDMGYVETTVDNNHWTPIITFTGNSVNPFNDDFESYALNIPKTITGLRFRFESNDTEINRGWMIDNIILQEKPTSTGDIIFESDGTSLDGFLNMETPLGCWGNEPWDYDYFVYDTGLIPDYGLPWMGDGAYDPCWGFYDPEWFTYFTPNLFPECDNALIWTIEDLDTAFYGWIEQGAVPYDLPTAGIEPNVSASLEISIDGGANWDVLEYFGGSANDDYQLGFLNIPTVIANDYKYWGGNSHVISDYLTVPEIQIRWYLQYNGGTLSYPGDLNPDGYTGIQISAPCFYGMEENNPPETIIQMQGTFDELYRYYTSEVAITLTATDDISGVAATYYELDGTQYTYDRPFIIDGDGEHTLCYWSVDNEGNVETKKCIAPFMIDESGPSVTISVADGPGIYIMGNKLLDSDKYVFLFGGVDLSASVSIDGAPLKTVEFYMNDILLGEDTAAPYNIRCTEKNSGAATFKVIAKDVLGESDEDSQAVDTYLKLF